VLTVCATVALLALGAVVTTFRVGMADPIWPTYPWHLLLISWQEPSPGFLIEHTHRAMGYIVGCCVIVLAAGLWFGQERRWLSWLGLAALLAVIVQGLLGGFRVRLNALVGTDLALVHGCFAQLVFALFVSLALFTSRGWTASALSQQSADVGRVRFWSVVTTGLVFLQLVLGGFVRHTLNSVGQRGHLLVAFAVVATMVWLWKTVHESEDTDPSLRSAVTFLAVLVALQVMLGVEAWMMKFGAGGLAVYQPVTPQQAIIRTAHFLVGSAILAASVVVTLRAHRALAVNFRLAAPPVRRMEGIA
jgi:cytochrome c oxidase assembly protein subunit 15